MSPSASHIPTKRPNTRFAPEQQDSLMVDLIYVPFSLTKANLFRKVADNRTHILLGPRHLLFIKTHFPMRIGTSLSPSQALTT